MKVKKEKLSLLLSKKRSQNEDKPIVKRKVISKTHIPQPSKLSKMKQKLDGSKFRWLNEKLYTSSSEAASKLFQSSPELFDVYHTGFRTQVTQWPVNPVDLVIKRLEQLNPASIADMGCGDAAIADHFKQKQVFSFDLVSRKKHVVACDIASVPLDNDEVDVVVFCLSLMGTNYSKFINEAWRICKPGGIMLIAEVESRFSTSGIREFADSLQNMGFQNISTRKQKVFVLFEFSKIERPDTPGQVALLSPCMYKKR